MIGGKTSEATQNAFGGFLPNFETENNMLNGSDVLNSKSVLISAAAVATYCWSVLRETTWLKYEGFDNVPGVFGG